MFITIIMMIFAFLMGLLLGAIWFGNLVVGLIFAAIGVGIVLAIDFALE